MVSRLTMLLKMSAAALRRSDAGQRSARLRMNRLRRESVVDSLEVRMMLSATGGAADHDHDVFAYDFLPPTLSLYKTGQYLTTAQQGKPLEIAEKFLKANSSSFGLSANDWTYRVSSSTLSQEIGTTHIYLQQTLGGRDVLNAVANVNVARDGAVMSAYSSFVATMGTAAAASPAISAAHALTSFVTDVGLGVTSNITSTFYASGKVPANVIRFGNADVTVLSAPGISRQAIPAQPVYIPVKDGLELGWRLNVQSNDGAHWYDAAVSAVDGDVLGIVDWSSDAQYNVFAKPKESPSDGDRTILVNPQNAVASPFGWHDTNGAAGAEFTVTQGNNVTAYTDTDFNNLPDPGSSPAGGASLIFNFPITLATQEPAAYQPAAVTNLFYWNNLIHDVLARNGFDEASGNFQVTNYSGLGTGGDPVLAEAQDGSGINNANFATPPEGNSPRMQMFRWTFTTPNRDSDLDNGVIVHEYGHGLSNRLTGGPANSSALTTIQSGGMGEGWSDFWALMFTQIAADEANDGRGIGTYVLGQAPDGAGIRSKRYSYDFAINNHTLGDIIGSTSVHSVGETWATTLWDLNWALIEGNSLDPSLPNAGMGFDSNLATGTGGNNLLMKLVIAGMKLQPANPSFLQARNAILEADLALTGGANQGVIWTVFARRGMGVSASDNGSGNTSVVPAFDIPLVTNLVFPLHVLPGTHVSRIQSPIAPFLNADETRTFRFYGEKDSRIAMTLTPTNPATVLTANIRLANGTLVFGPFTAAGAGQAVIISPRLLANDSNYKLEIHSTLLSGVQVDAARNTGLESQSGDSSPASGISLGNTFVNVGASRQAVIGNSNPELNLIRQSAPASFIDISATGTALGLTDDGFTNITTTVGNTLLPAGSVTISNNGHVRPGTVPALSFSNAALQASLPGLFPFWDDIDADTGSVYWEERSVGGINTLIIQWDDRPHYSNTGSATFQVQIFATGNTLVRFAYEDVVFGNAIFDNGASATIGVVSPTGELFQHSFNAVNAVVNGDKIDINVISDVDDYTFSAVAGQKIDVIFEGLKNVDMRASQVRLMQGTTILATAVPRPLSSSVTAANYDLGIVNFVIPATGTYRVRVTGKVKGDYLTLITKNAAFDTENSGGSLAPQRTMGIGINALGFLSSSTDTTDQYLLPLSSGQRVQIDLGRPFDNPLNTPLNSLVPRLQLRNPTGGLLATNTDSGPGGLPRIIITAATAGNYRLIASALSGFGEYTIKVISVGTGALSDPSAFDSNSRVQLNTASAVTTAQQPITWNALSGAASYSIWVDRVGGQSGILQQTGITDTSFAPAAVLPAGTYRVWLRAVGPNGIAGNWSSPLTITIVSGDATLGGESPQLEVQLVEWLSALRQDNLFTTDQRNQGTSDRGPAFVQSVDQSISAAQSKVPAIQGRPNWTQSAGASAAVAVSDRFSPLIFNRAEGRSGDEFSQDMASLDFVLSQASFAALDGWSFAN